MGREALRRRRNKLLDVAQKLRDRFRLNVDEDKVAAFLDEYLGKTPEEWLGWAEEAPKSEPPPPSGKSMVHDLRRVFGNVSLNELLEKAGKMCLAAQGEPEEVPGDTKFVAEFRRQRAMLRAAINKIIKEEFDLWAGANDRPQLPDPIHFAFAILEAYFDVDVDEDDPEVTKIYVRKVGRELRKRNVRRKRNI